MAAIVWLLGSMLPATWPDPLYLAVQMLAGIVIYWSLVHLFKVEAYQDARALVIEQWRLRREGRRRPIGKSV
jgi:hypothetical protein